MGKKIIIILSVIVVLLIASYFIINHQENKVQNLQQQIEYLEEEIVPMKFEIIKNNDSRIKLKSVFYDLNGEKKGSAITDLRGNELNIDFRIINFSDNNFLFFPYGLYTDKMAAADCIKIFDNYDKHGFPEIYNGITELEKQDGVSLNNKSKDKIRNSLINEFEKVKNNENNYSDNSYGAALHDIENIKKFQKGFIYKVLCHPHTGAIEIIRE